MPQFVTLVRYTQQGVAKIKESPARLDAAKKAAEERGGKIHAWYLTMGRCDAVLISEFPAMKPVPSSASHLPQRAM